MKKAILIICVLSVLALLVVPVVGGVLITESDLDRQLAPRVDGLRKAEMGRPTQIAGGGGRPGFNPP